MKTALALAVLFLTAAPQATSAPQPQMTARVILNTTTTATGQRITFPCNGARVVGSIVVIPPGYAPGYHKHPYPRYAYVLAGTLDVQDKGGKTRRYGPGSMFVETLNAWHRPRVEGHTPVRLLVIDQIPPSAKTNTIPE